MRIRLWLIRLFTVVVLISSGIGIAGCNSSSSFEGQLHAIVQPYAFSLLGWEASTLFNDAKQKIFHSEPESKINAQTVNQYFSYVSQLNSLKSDLQMVQSQKIASAVDQDENQIKEVETQILSLKPAVEQTISRQITTVLADQGIYCPLGPDWFKLTFPPVYFALEEPPNLLIISPRDKIETMHSITVQPDITTAQMEEMESSLEKLNVSALVVPLGGLGATYPSFVTNNADLKFTLDVASEEWLHQYLSFKPLGFRYVLDIVGISHNADISIIDETVAGVASQEIGNLVYDQYYAQPETDVEPVQSSVAAVAFDFNAAMRETRKTVDQYLASGQVDQAEKYMEEQRQVLIQHGYYIRKLNQAYFAFYGSYAYNETSVDPIGNETQLLRKSSLSLKDFLDKASGLTSRQELDNLVKPYSQP